MDDLRQSPAWAKYMESLGWETKRIGKAQLFLKKLPLGFSLIKMQRYPSPTPFEDLGKIAKERHTIFVKLEPAESGEEEALRKYGYKKDRWPLCPTKTLILSLTPETRVARGKGSRQRATPESTGGRELETGPTFLEIRSRFKKDTRYCLKKAAEAGLKINLSSPPDTAALKELYLLLKALGKRKNFGLPSLSELQHEAQAFGRDCFAVMTYQGAQPLAGALVFMYKDTAFYHHAASSKEGRALNAPYLVVWEVIKEAKKRGGKNLDFEGLADERNPQTRSWEGFSHFKKGFGGEEVAFPGSFIKYFFPFS